MEIELKLEIIKIFGTQSELFSLHQFYNQFASTTQIKSTRQTALTQ